MLSESPKHIFAPVYFFDENLPLVFLKLKDCSTLVMIAIGRWSLVVYIQAVREILVSHPLEMEFIVLSDPSFRVVSWYASKKPSIKVASKIPSIKVNRPKVALEITHTAI